jgi:selenocysteine lyase/cysteine desulfurase
MWLNNSMLIITLPGLTILESKESLKQSPVVQKTSAQLDFEKKGIDRAIRLSPHCFNAPQEVEKLTELIRCL